MAKFLGKVDEIPTRTRSGIWRDAFEKEFSKNPGQTYEYTEVSSSTAANLRRDYGLDAETVTVDGELRLYVTWRPEQADEIRSQYKEKAKKGKGNTGNGATSAPTPAPAQVKASK